MRLKIRAGELAKLCATAAARITAKRRKAARVKAAHPSPASMHHLHHLDQSGVYKHAAADLAEIACWKQTEEDVMVMREQIGVLRAALEAE